MSIESRTAVCLVALALAPVALAQTSGKTATESTAVSTQTISGVVETVAGNKVVLRQADGLHEYNLPDGFAFQLEGRNVGVSEIKPGMTVNAVVTDKVTTRQVTLTQIRSGTVAQIAPGGIVLRDQNGNLKSYNFKDAAGNDIYFVRDGSERERYEADCGSRLDGHVTGLPRTASPDGRQDAVTGQVYPVYPWRILESDCPFGAGH